MIRNNFINKTKLMEIASKFLTGTVMFLLTSLSHADQNAKEKLGEHLFFDTNLSVTPGQSCASCHSPEAAFSEADNSIPVTKGIIPGRAGNRNVPVASYMAFSPEFYYDEKEQLYIGGQFWDGRSKNLEEQAKGPLLNPLEMANPDKKSVVEKVKHSFYVNLFKNIYGDNIFNNSDQAYDAIADAIAHFERTKQFNPFTSKYDYYLKGKVELSKQEMRGLKLFEAEDKANCAACHLSKPDEANTPPLFTDFTYDNLGVPRNPDNPFYKQEKAFNPDGLNYVDKGLADNPQVIADNRVSESLGKMKVPTLRNIAITAPYMHNGYFKDLRAVVDFYNTRDVKTQCNNIFTNEKQSLANNCWPVAEVKTNVNKDELGDLKLTDDEVDDLVAFMKTLTDGYQLNPYLPD